MPGEKYGMTRTWKTIKGHVSIIWTNSAPEPWILDFQVAWISPDTFLFWFITVFLFFMCGLFMYQQVAVISTIAGVISSRLYVSTKAGYENAVVAKVDLTVVPGVGAGNTAWMNACSLKWTRYMASKGSWTKNRGKVDIKMDGLGGGLKYFLFSPLFGEMIQFD